jgi:hypothetical protein
MSNFDQGAVASNFPNASGSAASCAAAAPATTPVLFAEPDISFDRQLEPAATLSGLPVPQRHHVRHMLFGTLLTVQATIRQLHQLGYAEVNDWSRPIPTGNPDKVMAILVKRVVVE